MLARLRISLTIVASIMLFAIPAATAGHDPAHIAGTTGEISDPDASFGGFFLRYVGDPAPAGYSHSYQWSNPSIEVFPADGPVVFEGTLDLTQRQNDNSVSMIGVVDTRTLENGDNGYQIGAYIYVNNRTNGTVRVGPTDGNLGGEIVQTFVTVPESVADAGPIGVTFTIDGTADPASCATGPSGGADGCLTLELDGFATLTDSYGSVVGSGGPDEFAEGGVPGWEVFPSGGGITGYDLTISPADVAPQTKQQCMNGGWESYGFKNQGQCIRFVETGKDSR